MAESPSSKTDVHILGGGLAGMSCGSDLSQNGKRVKVLEAQPKVGGLAQSFEVDGHTCDLGPHRFHSNSDAIVDHIKKPLQGKLHMRDRLSRIYIFGKFFHYPLQAGNILGLPKLVLLRAGIDYLVMRVRLWFKPIPDDCFENYVRKRFGNTLYRIFFGTYTEKTWQISPKYISADWAGQRITLLNLWDVAKKTLFPPKNVPRTYVSRFHYPTHGGVGAISEGYQRIMEETGSEIICDARISRVIHENNVITAVEYERNGELHQEPVGTLVSTLPIDEFIKMMEPALPADILQAASNLKHKAIIFVYIMLNREQVTEDHWVYLPEKHLRVHRISEFKNFSEHSAPKDKTLLCAEITSDPHDETWNLSDDELLEMAVKDLTKIPLFDRSEISGFTIRRVNHAYPLYDLTYRENLQVLLGHLKKFSNLTSTGRQGLFRYGNMDHSVAMGARVARTLNTGKGPDHSQIAADANESFDG